MIKYCLTYSITFIGLKAPWFSWITSIVLLFFSTRFIYKQQKFLNKLKKTCEKINSEIKKIQSEYIIKGNRGINSFAIDKLNRIFSEVQYLKNKWDFLRFNLIYRTTPENEDMREVWRTNNAEDIFQPSDFYGKDINRGLIISLPGIITGIGLLMTFVAILVGLLDVSIIDNKVHGLENLIGGLSGKFISSVAALLFSTILLFYEKYYFFIAFNRIRYSLLESINSLIPLKSESSILEDIYLNISEQTNTFRTFNTDLSKTLQSSFKENTGPTLDRMVSAIDNLNTLTDASKSELLDAIREMNKLLSRSEQSRQESMSGQIESLLRDLKDSLALAIGNMSKEFTKSLSGSTQEQFTNIAEIVGRMGSVLEYTATQSTESQVAIKDLITLSRQSTESQIVNSSGLIEKMVKVVGATLAHMEKKMIALSEKMTNTIEDTAVKSAETASGVIDEVKTLNIESSQKLIQILQKHEDQLDRVENLKLTLNDAIEAFGEYVTGYNKINSNLKIVTLEANNSLQLLSSSSQKLRDGQGSFEKMAELTMNNIQKLSESNDHQQVLWSDIYHSMEQYKKTFESVESSATEILSTISSKLQDFSRSTQDHFSKTLTVADDHVNRAVKMLSSSIDELREGLEDLSEIVSEMNNIKTKIQK